MATLRSENRTDAFWEDGYVVADDLVDASQLIFARLAMDASLRAGRFHPSQARRVSGGGLNEYSAVGAEAILRGCQPAIAAIVGRELVPTYAFWRIYPTGGLLNRHVDRDSCEISVSLPILADPVEPHWPIYVCDLHGEERAIAVSPGAGIIYQGCRVPHWREPFTGNRQYQLFLHYVIKDGERARFAFDCRGALEIGTGRPESD